MIYIGRFKKNKLNKTKKEVVHMNSDKKHRDKIQLSQFILQHIMCQQ